MINVTVWCDEYFRAECEKASIVLDHREITARWTADPSPTSASGKA